ncbi:MAG: response regulator transcription factor [Anaerolineae bacterium]|jgi:DNA-binding response OmpR family regulator
MQAGNAAEILVVDDVPEMADFLREILIKEGYQVAVAHSAREGLRRAHQDDPDLVLLDAMMPGMDGWTMLDHLREFSNVPVIMVTVVDGLDEKVRGLDHGADDYVTKPFEIQELMARIRAALRRASVPPAREGSVLAFDEERLVVNPTSYQVMCRGKQIKLSPIEHSLIVYLAVNAGRVLTYDQILENVWGPDPETSLSNLKVYIRRLRQKLELDPSRPRYILNQWGIGYYMDRI